MTHPLFVSVLYSLVQYLGLSLAIYWLTTIYGETGKSLKTTELFNFFNYRFTPTIVVYLFFTLLLLLLKVARHSVEADDMALPLVNAVVVIATWIKSEFLYRAEVRARSVRYLVVKYKCDYTKVMDMLLGFGVSRFPINQLEQALCLNEEQRLAKTIDDPVVLASAERLLASYQEEYERLVKAKAFQDQLCESDRSNYPYDERHLWVKPADNDEKRMRYA
jgi:hypothetical protein